MQKITNEADLKTAIELLEFKQVTELALVKMEFRNTYDKLKPINLIKSKIKEAISNPDLKTDLINTAIGVATGYVTKKVFTGKTHNPITKLVGTVLEIIVAKKVSKNADGIRSIASIILEKLIKQKHDSEKT